uniref:Reverse transcriptase Ty1/copia-type domain-containing protein n=1 Tax=Tanacetum cinerariifolium TaxID=118510 RepID=A0A6L2NB44_TANCI|nr:hypothetical protein [Tanacetum cinerariifolium]
MPLKPDLSFITNLDESTDKPVASKPVVETSEAKTNDAKTSEAKPKEVRKNNGALIIEDWVFDSEDEDVPKPKIEKKTVKPIFDKIEIENLVDHMVKVIRCDNGTEFKNREMNQFYEMKVNTDCYVQNRVFVVKPHNKTPFELFHGRTPMLNFMRPFRCPVTILNTLDHLGKFIGKADEELFIGYSMNSKAFRVFNSRTRIVEENLHIRFSENTPNIVGSRPDWLFDIDALTRSMNHESIVTGIQSNGFAGTKASDKTGQASEKTSRVKDYILLPLRTTDLPFSQGPKSLQDDGSKPSSDDGKQDAEDPGNESKFDVSRIRREDHEKEFNVTHTNNIPTISSTLVNVDDLPDDANMPELEDIGIFDYEDDENVGAKADINILDTINLVSPILTTSIYKDHSIEQVIGDLHSATQTRRSSKNLEEHGAIGSKWVFRNKKDEKGIVIRNKARLVAQGHTQEERIDYDEVFSSVARIEAIRLFLAYASFKDFMVYQMDVKSSFLYGKIKEEVYVCPPPGFEDTDFPDRVYKEMCIAFEKLMHKKFQMSSMGELTFFLGLQLKQKDDGIFISQDKYVVEILEKFGLTTVKTASTPMETQKPLLKDEDGEEVDVHIDQTSLIRDCNEKKLIQMVKIHTDKNVADFLTKAFDDDKLVRAATTASILEAEQDNSNIIKTQSKATLNEPSFHRTSSGSGLRCQETIGVLLLKLEDQGRINDEEMFDAGILEGEEVFTEKAVPKKGVEVSTAGNKVTTISNNGKAKMIKEPMKPKKKEQIKIDEETALRLQAKFNEEARLLREQAKKEQEANDALTKTRDDIQAKIDADYQLTEQMQAEKRVELTDAGKATLFAQLLKKRRTYFTAKRAKEKRNKPPTQAQQKKILCTYL